MIGYIKYKNNGYWITAIVPISLNFNGQILTKEKHHD